MKYNYLENVKNDVKEYIEENKENERYNFENLEELKQLLFDDLWIDDSVTGNGSGSYTFSTYQAEENISHNMDLLKEACQEFGANAFDMLENPEKADVTIRCYLLNQAIEEVIDEITKEKNKTIITITKSMECTTDTNGTIKKKLFVKKTNDLQEALKLINDEKLECYNNKFVTVFERIEALYKTESGSFKRIYKEIDPKTKQIKKEF